MLVSNAIALVVVVGAGVPLVSMYGAKGAAIAMVAAELTLGFCYERSLSFKQPEMRLRLGFVLRAAAATLGAGAIALALDVSPIASALIGSALYLAALLALRIVPPEIRDALFKRRHSV